MKKIRVVQFGTGMSGICALRSIVANPALELVGCYVHSANKAGRDAGELSDERGIGKKPLGHIGITTTNSWEELLALEPDCLAYFGDGRAREPAVIADIAPFLAIGTDVLTTSLLPLTYPQSAPSTLRDPLEEACRRGKSSFYNGGLDPGFATGTLALALLSTCDAVEEIRLQELGNYGDFPVEWLMREVFGFGQPLEFERPIYSSGALHRWRGTVQFLADQMGATLDDIIMVSAKPVAHPTDLETTWGRVPAGTTAAIQFEIQGLIKGKPRIILEHVTFCHPDVEMPWDKPTGEPGKVPPHQYRVLVKGEPNLNCRFDCPSTDEALMYTANHVVNAIPSVCAAAPGLLSIADLPYYFTKNLT